jgi:hypothetical protein
MLIVMAVAGAAALVVVAYAQLRNRSPEAATEALRVVRDLAAVVLVCVKAVEGIADVLGGHRRIQAAPSGAWGYPNNYDYEEDER